jgi:hypothetical protein
VRRIDLDPYSITTVNVEGDDFVEETRHIDPRAALRYLLAQPALAKDADATMTLYAIAERTRQADGDALLLEEAEWKAVRDAVTRVSGLGAAWAPLLRRIQDAPTVEVRECH